jgi:CBS domain-containing protein
MPTLVDEVMSTPARTVRLTEGRRAIVETLAQNHIGAVPVVDEADRVVGIVSESDLMPRTPTEQMARGAGLAGGHRWGPDRGEPEARAIMRAPAVTIQARDTLAEASRRMRRAEVHHLPVVDAGERAVGMLSRGDLLKVFTRSDEEIREAVVQGLLVAHLWMDPSQFVVTVRNGIVSLQGKLPRRSDVMRFQRLLPTIDGVVGVEGTLDYRWDDMSQN